MLFPPYFAQYLYPVGFSSFLFFHPAPYSCGCGTCMMWSFFLELGGTVITTWTGRESDDCVVFRFIFVYAVLFLVLGPRRPWSWQRLSSPSCCPTSTVVLMISVAPNVVASSSPD